VGGDLCQRPRCWYFRNGYGLLAMQGETSLVRNGDNRYHAVLGNDGPALFVSPSSLGPVLLALGAEITATGPGGKTRKIPIEDFFHTPRTEKERETTLRPNEILTEIHVPIQGLKNATYEVRHRQGLDWPYATATVAFELEGGAARNCRVALGHVAPTPWLATAAARVLNGANVNESSAARCGEASVEGARALSGNGYKIQMIKAAVKRAALAAAA
jgi:xanthine dehydrogenase YagS FAD-binding subunit